MSTASAGRIVLEIYNEIDLHFYIKSVSMKSSM